MLDQKIIFSYSKIVPRKETEVKKLIKFLIGFIVLGIASVYDLKEYRVPNYCIVLGLVAGFFIQIFQAGMVGCVVWITSVGVIWLLLFPFSLLGMFGAGDVKLFMVIASLFGVVFTMRYAIVALFVGAIYAVFQMLWHRNLLNRLRFLATYFRIIFLSRTIIKYRSNISEEDSKNLIPFVVPMELAFVLLELSRSQGLSLPF